MHNVWNFGRDESYEPVVVGWMEGRGGWIEKPLSFCLVKLYMLTRDAPTPNLSS